MNIDVTREITPTGNTRITSLEYRAWMAVFSARSFTKSDRKRDLEKADRAYKVGMGHTRIRRRRYWLNSAISYARRAFDLAKVQQFERWHRDRPYDVIGL